MVEYEQLSWVVNKLSIYFIMDILKNSQVLFSTEECHIGLEQHT